jgi:hypothetical protein
MGLFDNLINGLVGLFDWKERKKPFSHTDVTQYLSQFIPQLNKILDKPVTQVYLMVGCIGKTDIKAGEISGGIQGAQEDGGSFFSHVYVFPGEAAGDYMRKKYSILLTNPKIPPKAEPLEIVEAEAKGVVVQSLNKYLTDEFQMYLYGRYFTLEEAEKILLRAYGMIGTEYDFREIAKHVFGFIPDDSYRKVCSSYASYAFEVVERLAEKNVERGFENPKDVNHYLFPKTSWDLFKFSYPKGVGG